MKSKSSLPKLHVQTALALVVITSLLLATGVLAYAGDLDPTFDGDGKVVTAIRDTDDLHALAIQQDGKIVAAGDSTTGMKGDFSLARYNTNGSLDASFDGDGKVVTDIDFAPNGAYAVALQPDGKIVAAGQVHHGDSFDDFAVVRYNSNGTLDTSFDGDGIVVTDIGLYDSADAVAIQNNGKIVVAGRSWLGHADGNHFDYALVRYYPDGSLDEDFDEDGIVVTDIQKGDIIHDMLIQPDGRILVTGVSNEGSYLQDFSLARYNTDGSLDTSFDWDGKVVTDIQGGYNTASAITLQPDGRIVVAGTTQPYMADGTADFTVVRYNKNGSCDSNFDWDGIVVSDFGHSHDRAQAVAVQLDGKIVVGGGSTTAYGYDYAIVRYLPDGQRDITFNGNGTDFISILGDDELESIAFQKNGKLVMGGTSDNRYSLARIDMGALAFYSEGSEDGWVLESAENSNVGGIKNSDYDLPLRIGDNLQNKQFRTILSFRTEILPDGMLVTNATLLIRRQGTTGTSPFNLLGNLVADIRKGWFTARPGLDVNDFQGYADKTAVATFHPTAGSILYGTNIPSASFSYINRIGPTQFRLRFTIDDDNDLGADFASFYSGEANPIFLRPVLLIEYQLP